MQVSVESTSELGRKMTVHVPEEKIQGEIASRLKNLAGKVKIDGFRPGKVPAALIQKRYGDGVREEVLADLIQSSFYEAVEAEKLNPAGGPTITPQASADSAGFSYVADFEVVPEVKLEPLENLTVARWVSEVTEADVDNMVAKLQEQRKTWKSADRPAVTGDRLVIAFEGLCNGENFTNGRVENFNVVIGSGQLIPGFEEKLVGLEPNSELDFDIDFPADYGNAALAGKSANFKVSVSAVDMAALPEMDKSFVTSFGIESGDVDEFRADIKGNMEREMARALKTRDKSSVMDELYARYSELNLPEVMVKQEVDDLVKPYLESAKKANQQIDQTALRDRLLPVANRRVTLALILGRLIDAEKVRVDAKRVRSAIEDMALSYEDPAQVVNWYYSNKEQINQVENMVLEDQLVDVIFARAQVAEKHVPFQELMQPQGQGAS